MADERSIEGKNMVFLIDPLNGTAYDLVVCLTSNSYSRSASVIDASSKCGTEKLNGVKDRTISLEGIVRFSPDVGHMSEAELNTLFENDTPFGWLFGPEVPADEDVYYTGTDAIISSLEISAPMDGVTTFSATVQLTGVPVMHTEGS